MTTDKGFRTLDHVTREATGRFRIIGHYGGYRKMYSFGFTCLVYHATTLFCKRNFNYKNDALGKTVGQMVGAARSARQNIVEASSRAATSKEQELRQLDVAKGSLDELAGDYEVFLVDAGEAPWSQSDERYQAVKALQLDAFDASDDLDHEFGKYILAMRRRCVEWLESEDPLIAANAILITIRRAAALLKGQMDKTADAFLVEGGFTERMSRARIAARDENARVNHGAPPKCPRCGRNLHKILARKGRNAGNEFWGCTGYPECDFTRNV